MVIRCAAALGLYVFSEQGISMSAEHQWPGRQSLHSTEPVVLAYVPGVHGEQLTLRGLLADVPTWHGRGAALPGPL